MTTTHSDLSFNLLSLLSKERGVYGLRNGDHERYRKHCSNKLHRLRQVTNLTAGKGKVYKKPTPLTDSSVSDIRHLQLLLFCAERALAHSHSLKAITSKPPYPRALRKEQLSWLRRALGYSKSLHHIASSLASKSSLNQRTLAEVTIYHLSIRAELEFERSQWAETLTDLSARRNLLSTFADAAKDSYDQALALEFMDAYDPLIRFGAYKLGRAESHDIEGVVRDVDEEMMEEAVPGYGKLLTGLREELGAAEMEAGRKDLEDITFAGDKIPLRSAEIVRVMLRVQEGLGKLGKGKGMKGWDRVLSVLGEAEGIAKKLLDDHEASASSTSLRSAETTKVLSQAHQYILYLLLSYRVRRDLLLIESLKSSANTLPSDISNFKVPGGKVKLEEAVKALAAIVKLYDTVLQSVTQIRSLAIVEEKDSVRTGVEGIDSYFHATKYLYLARLHCIHPSPSYASAVQLLSRAGRSQHQASLYLLQPDEPIQESITTVSEEELKNLAEQISKLELAAKRSLFAERVPKPVFFDTAFNYIDLPMEELLYRAGKGPAPTAPLASTVAAAATQVAEKAQAAVASVVEQMPAVSKEVKNLRQTRESTPADGGAAKADGSQQKGWLGGWFGRG